jgi:hypothetical protein
LPASRFVFGLFLSAVCGGGLKVNVGIFLKIGSDFNQNIPPIYTRRVFRLAPPLAGLGVCQDFERIAQVQIHMRLFGNPESHDNP